MNILNLSRKLLLLLTVAIFFACDKDNDDVKPDQPDDKPQTSAQEKLLKQNITISKLLLSITAHQEIKDNKIVYSATYDPFEGCFDKFIYEYTDNRISKIAGKFTDYKWYWTKNQLDSICSYNKENDTPELESVFYIENNEQIKSAKVPYRDKKVTQTYTYNENKQITKIESSAKKTHYEYNAENKLNKISYSGYKLSDCYTFEYKDNKISKSAYYEKDPNNILRRCELSYSGNNKTVSLFRKKELRSIKTYKSNFDKLSEQYIIVDEIDGKVKKTIKTNTFDKDALIKKSKEKYLVSNGKSKLIFKLDADITNDNQQNIIGWKSTISIYNTTNFSLTSKKEYIFSEIKDNTKNRYKFIYPDRISEYVAKISPHGGSHLYHFAVVVYDKMNNNQFITAEKYNFEGGNPYCPSNHKNYFDKDFKKIKVDTQFSTKFSDWPFAFKKKTVITYNEKGEKIKSENFTNDKNTDEKINWIKS